MLGHELTHIRNGDVRMLVIAVIIAGVIGFFAEMVFRMLFHERLPPAARRAVAHRQRRTATARAAAAWSIVIIIAIALIAAGLAAVAS